VGDRGGRSTDGRREPEDRRHRASPPDFGRCLLVPHGSCCRGGRSGSGAGRGPAGPRPEGIVRTDQVATAAPAPAPAPAPGNSLSWLISDARVIAKRNLLHFVRVPALFVFSIVQPIMFVLLFRYVFGGVIAGLPPGVNYVS